MGGKFCGIKKGVAATTPKKERRISRMENIAAKVDHGQPKSWRNVYKTHPAADLVVKLPGDGLRKLTEDIKAHELRNSVKLQGQYNAKKSRL